MIFPAAVVEHSGIDSDAIVAEDDLQEACSIDDPHFDTGGFSVPHGVEERLVADLRQFLRHAAVQVLHGSFHRQAEVDAGSQVQPLGGRFENIRKLSLAAH